MDRFISVLQEQVTEMERAQQRFEETFKSILPHILGYLNEKAIKKQQFVNKIGMNHVRIEVAELLEAMERICLENKKKDDKGDDEEGDEEDDEEENEEDDEEEDNEEDDEEDNEEDDNEEDDNEEDDDEEEKKEQ